ncbi:MAG: type I-E CRISPR-associated protein Cse1/CasA [Spiribacter salinus]|uniref:Type I-E CRISPR-associated protein Cse1/CasA n=1 Tax=Spiribacter salinus TaxID=1335746 RepID=A0A540VQJ3_9GAMM|nr:MAG: type I-E CRISPR-associated protein Cse1/CasA [Spiribacter salinus]
MNLLEDQWLPLRTRDGGVRNGPPSAIADSDVVDIAFPRADFDGAAWQFLIGLLQTTVAPEDHEAWEVWWRDPPDAAGLEESFAPCRQAFDVYGEGPRFMQDRQPLDDARAASVASLLIDAPGDQGIKFNTDHFVKRGIGETMCPRCAAVALYTMQINAPSGGQGHRTGLRGGGPLTTLVLPEDDDQTLWRKLWLNVLPTDSLDRHAGWSAHDYGDWRVFPWLAATRTSDKAGKDTTPNDVHPLHMYWAMPRRFRLLLEDTACECAVCGQPSEQSVHRVRARNYGYNYTGPWRHPLTPYRFDPKKPAESPISLKGQQGGLGYRHWEPLVLEDREVRGNLPALVVRDYTAKAREISGGAPGSYRARLWVFGYDMDNMKPRGWYAIHMPLVAIPESSGARARLLNWVDTMTTAAASAAGQLRNAVKAAWYARPKDAAGDFSFVEQRLWEATEEPFYSCLATLAASAETVADDMMPPEVATRWYRVIQHQSLAVFDGLTLAGDAEALNMKRAIAARNGLQRRVLGSKEMKQLRAWAGLNQSSGSETASTTAKAGETT